MPNHVSQDLYITGDTASLKQFKELAQNHNEDGDIALDHERFIPYPDHFKQMDMAAKVAHKAGILDVKDGFNSGGYQWCLQAWGTKWGIYASSLVSQKLTGKKGRLTYSFRSAWSPPLPIIDAMSKQFPSLHFRLKWFERGMAVKGIYIAQGGAVLEQSEDKYHGSRGG